MATGNGQAGRSPQGTHAGAGAAAAGEGALRLGNRTLGSRLIVGTGKYPSMELMREAIDASLADELPAQVGEGAVVDADFLTTRITMDVILRTLFSHATSHAEAMRISVAIRALTRQSMREVFWAWIPPAWPPGSRRTPVPQAARGRPPECAAWRSAASGAAATPH